VPVLPVQSVFRSTEIVEFWKKFLLELSFGVELPWCRPFVLPCLVAKSVRHGHTGKVSVRLRSLAAGLRGWNGWPKRPRKETPLTVPACYHASKGQWGRWQDSYSVSSCLRVV
jgi:hypothetical protein